MSRAPNGAAHPAAVWADAAEHFSGQLTDALADLALLRTLAPTGPGIEMCTAIAITWAGAEKIACQLHDARRCQVRLLDGLNRAGVEGLMADLQDSEIQVAWGFGSAAALTVFARAWEEAIGWWQAMTEADSGTRAAQCRGLLRAAGILLAGDRSPTEALRRRERLRGRFDQLMIRLREDTA